MEYGIDTQTEQGFNSMHISSYKTSDGKFDKGNRLIRYHYASAHTLPLILSQNPSLRFTDVRFMNDYSEMVCCVKAILNYLDKYKGKYQFCEETVYELLSKKRPLEEYKSLTLRQIEFNNVTELHYCPIRCFAFCMSRSDDLLNMWNYYIHDSKYEGYNVGFDVYNFLKSFDTDQEGPFDPIAIHYGKVLYTEKEQFKEVEQLVQKIENRSRHESPNSSEHSSAVMQSAIYLRHYIESFGAFFKDEAFKGEQEYRVVIEISENRLFSSNENYSNNNLKNMKLEYFVRKGVLVPYLEVPFNKNAVKSVTMSPIMEHDLAKISLEEFLHKNGYKAEIKTSKIPIRF